MSEAELRKKRFRHKHADAGAAVAAGQAVADGDPGGDGPARNAQGLAGGGPCGPTLLLSD